MSEYVVTPSGLGGLLDWLCVQTEGGGETGVSKTNHSKQMVLSDPGGSGKGEKGPPAVLRPEGGRVPEANLFAPAPSSGSCLIPPPPPLGGQNGFVMKKMVSSAKQSYIYY